MDTKKVIKMLDECYKNKVCINVSSIVNIIDSDEIKVLAYKVNKNYVLDTYGRKHKNNKTIQEGRKNLEIRIYKKSLVYLYLFVPNDLGFTCLCKKIIWNY